MKFFLDSKIIFRHDTLHVIEYLSNNIKGEGAKIATVIFKMDNFGTRNFDGAKPDIINQNGTNLALLNIGVKFDR